MNLTADQIKANWDTLIGYIEKYISAPRKEQLLKFYTKYEDRLIIMPAAHKKEYHNAFPGGYVEHVNRVIEAAIKINQVWIDFGVEQNYTTEELVFSALNHDLGKMGDSENESYIPQTDKWRQEKLGEDYTFNKALEFMTVPDRGLYLLTENGISYTKNEYLAIKLHDGLYDDSNKPYLLSWMPETKVRTALVHIVHQADFLAAKVEFEREWFPKFKGNLESPKTNTTLPTKRKTPTKLKALNKVTSPGLGAAMSDFFNED